MNLLRVGKDAKTVKGEKLGVMTGIMYLTPHKGGGGQNLCPFAEMAQCYKPCLYTAGRGRMSNVQAGRLRRTHWYNSDPKGFVRHLIDKEIPRVIRKAERAGMTPMIRLNGTSDIMWETQHPEVLEAFPDVQFYDYTKIPSRRDVPINYHLTWSYSGADPKYAAYMDTAIRNGMNVAVVFRKNVPSTWRGYTVVDGDANDVRPYDPMPAIVGLKAKGSAKHDVSGFVVDE